MASSDGGDRQARSRWSGVAGVARSVFALMLVMLALPVGGARAADDPAITGEPRKVIEEAAVEVVAILAQRERPAEERISAIEEIAFEIFDFTTMSKLVLARNWRKMEPGQRSEFVREFKRHLSRTYGSRLDRYDQEDVEVYAAQLEPRNDVSVKTRIVGGQFDKAEISYRLRKRKERWKIIDVVIEGVSLISNYRSQFAEVLNSGTIDDLLAKLRDKNFKIDDGSEATDQAAATS
ncbi:MAG: ABC transporter substrate-binding protein [Deltaproteobacteria bacterium]|nr:ABC transporter substrate-binding protein [Deltaproteobacteria bacterium]